MDDFKAFKIEMLNSMAATFTLLIHEIEQNGTVTKAGFAELAESHARQMPDNPATGVKGSNRYETIFLETLVAALRHPLTEPTRLHSVPGGKSDGKVPTG